MRAHLPLLAVSVAASALLLAVSRKPILTWGATDDEAYARHPGDDLLEDADGESTRAIGIDAPPGAVWPWLVQMGPAPRGGAYTYDWIENMLGLDMHSADRVLADFQSPAVGDAITLGSRRMVAELVATDTSFAWRSADHNWVWAFHLIPDGSGTRLVSRNRYRLPSRLARTAALPMEAASLVMERKMLLGVKQRAERLAGTERGASGPAVGRAPQDASSR